MMALSTARATDDAKVGIGRWVHNLGSAALEYPSRRYHLFRQLSDARPGSVTPRCNPAPGFNALRRRGRRAALDGAVRRLALDQRGADLVGIGPWPGTRAPLDP